MRGTGRVRVLPGPHLRLASQLALREAALDCVHGGLGEQLDGQVDVLQGGGGLRGGTGGRSLGHWLKREKGPENCVR